MEISSLFPSSDNLYKFLFMGGVFMLVFTFIYPLEKKQNLELEINVYNKQVELLNNEILLLQEDVHELKKLGTETYKKLELTKLEKDKKIAEARIKQLKEQYNNSFNITKTKENEMTTKNIILKFEKSKIELMKEHINSFNIFHWLFLIIGFMFTIFGLYKWNKTTQVAEAIQKKELKK